MLTSLLRAPALDFAAVAAYLDSLVDAARVNEVRHLEGRDQARLFDAAHGARSIDASFFVPAGGAPLTPVTHAGKNSLALFTAFEKVFYRVAGDGAREVAGYNRAGGFVETVVGPGYFTVTTGPEAGEMLIDYTTLPTTKPEGTPAILSNAARLSRVVYNGTQDIMRGVSSHVSIGRAMRGGKAMDNWFVLCRSVGEAPAP